MRSSMLDVLETEFYEKVIHQNDDKFFQIKLVVGEFRGKQYVHIRKHFLSYENEYIPSREGVSMEASIDNILSLLDGLAEIASKSEIAHILEKHGEKYSLGSTKI